MATRLNPAEQTAAESDYKRKFNQQSKSKPSESAQAIKEQERAGDATWKTVAQKKPGSKTQKKGFFRFSGRRGGKIRQGSTFLFIFGLLAAGVWYVSVLAPNILLVNVKEMYTNDLADATTALEIYTQIMYFNKIGPLSGQDCLDGQPMDKQPIKCKLTTMSRSQKQAFERQGFTFGFGDINIAGAKINADLTAKKVYEDKRDDGDSSNDLPESRWKVYAILPPNYKQIIDSAKANGLTSFSGLMRQNPTTSTQVTNAVNQLFNPLNDASKSPQKLLDSMLSYAPITSGPQLWLYSQLSSTAKAQVFGVFNPKSSFFADERFKERIKTRYNMTKQVTVAGQTEQKVNQSFDSAVKKIDGGIDPLTGQPNPTDGVSLASLGGSNALSQLKSIVGGLKEGVNQQTVSTLTSQLPVVADMQVAGNLLASNTYSYTDLMCSWYTIGKISSNALIRAKASTAARYALQYLKAADAIKAGTAQEIPTNILAGKLAQGTLGGYNSGSATDSFIYRAITYGDYAPGTGEEAATFARNSAADAAAIVTYNLSAYENIGTLAASWAQVIPNAAALGAVIGASGMLTPPPFSLTGSDKQYCQSGETTDNKTNTKGQSTETTLCTAAVEAMAPIGMQPAVAGAAEVGRRTCPPVNASDDNLIKLYLGQWRGPVSNTILPSQKITQAAMTPYVAGWFGANTMAAAAGTQLLYTSQIKGIAANYALFSGAGEVLGDMAMSRGLMPSNAIDMELYLNLGEMIGTEKNETDIARHNAKQNPFDPYNKFSFAGSLLRNLPQTSSESSPIFATVTNMLSLVGSSAKKVGQLSTANAFYHSQPSLLTGNNAAERMSGYLLRLSGTFCAPDLEYLSIGITPDVMCNVRYSMPIDDIATAINLSGVIDYMTSAHSNVYDANTRELNERVGKADIEGNKPYLQERLDAVNNVKNKPFIDKTTGKPIAGGEYEKYLQYCVNRLDPWGRSAIAMRYDGLTDDQKKERDASRTPNGEATSPDNPGDPYQKYPGNIPLMAVTASQSDQDWYTGKKCTRMTDQPEMLKYFRAYTTMCSVDGSMSGIIDCTERDTIGDNYSDPFYLNNDILYTSWY